MSENHTPTSRARQLRWDSTEVEKILWQKLRNRKFHGLKFLRQHPIVYDEINGKQLFFVPDFYCAEKKTIVEIDGKIHDFQKDYDENREEILKNMGIKILRLKNEEVGNIAQVLKRIENFMGLLTLIATASQSSLSTRREGEEGESKCRNTKNLNLFVNKKGI